VEPRPTNPATLCARAPRPVPSATSPLTPALEASVVHRIASLDEVDALYEGRTPGFVYARDGHPNLVQLAAKVARLESAEAAWIGASGMAVESASLLALLEAGDRLALADGVYGKTFRLAAELRRFGVEIDRFDAADPSTLRTALGPRTRVVFVETLSNPLLRLADVPALADLAGSAGASLVVDHTFAPTLLSPLALGADLVTHSATKMIGGHSDLTLGVVAGRRATIDRIAAVGSTFGLTGNPYECWMALRGLATLDVRMQRASVTALSLAQRLAAHPRVRAVHHPGLAEHPDHARARALLTRGFGSMLTFDVGGRAEADALIRALVDVIPFAPSLGDVQTTLSHPATTSHRGQSAEQWKAQGITPGLVRLSVGIEDPEDLVAELLGALDRLD
jgi:cystathionine beta-lyase/cystathionine gamma-synthase